MKAQSINWSVNQTPSHTLGKKLSGISQLEPAAMGKAANSGALNSAFESATQHAVRASIATVVVSGIFVAAIWASEVLGSSGIVEAFIWATSFVFLALAVEASTALFKPLLATGLSLGILALLSAPGNIGFTLLAAALVAAWTAWAILQGWKKQITA